MKAPWSKQDQGTTR
eukprot:symbB.v1.2.044129.t1/scaffold26286.1/size404/1